MNTYDELDKFPICFEKECLMPLEIQNRFKCGKCAKIFCGEHRLQFNHRCFLVTNEYNSSSIKK